MKSLSFQTFRSFSFPTTLLPIKLIMLIDINLNLCRFLFGIRGDIMVKLQEINEIFVEKYGLLNNLCNMN